MNGPLGLNILFGDVKAELKMGEPELVKVIGGGGRRPEAGGKLAWGTGVVGIIGIILDVEVGCCCCCCNP